MNAKGLKLDAEELQILEDLERGELVSIRDFKREKRALEEAATRTLQKDKRINRRMTICNLCSKQDWNCKSSTLNLL